jgi:acetyl esterase/lipase
VDLATGERTLVVRETQARAQLSAGGRFAWWWDFAQRVVVTYDLRTGTTVTVTAAIPHPLDDEEHDSPMVASPYGVAGWTDDDREVLIYDRYDVWAVDPTGRRAPRNVTDGVGRRDSVRIRLVDLDREREAIPSAEPLLLAAFDYRTKAAGFLRDRVTGDGAPEQLLWMDRQFSTPRKAAAAGMLLYTRESLAEFPDLWTAGLDFARPVRLSDANPQQAEYRWATVELVRWRGADGTPLAGLLYKPADFDSTKQYPMIVNFYERNSDNLHAHSPVIPHRSTIRPSFYASRGYLVFIPDVVYQVGYPGQSAFDCVVPGVLALIDRGFVDPKRIGLQGHSWGGYQIAYLVTKTDLFAAAEAGAPVANMTSAYGGIRWETGMSRMFQYERTQSRLGASLWDAPLRYVENSPLFWLDRVETPLLILHNDEDGAVPWYQGIELFTGLRRLGKPAWLVNYNGEPHWPLPYPKRRDWNIRMQQFFDHYLMGAPAPRWMAEGVPAVEKGRTLGLETEW